MNKNKTQFFKKILLFIFASSLVVLAATVFLFTRNFGKEISHIYGVSFSKKYAEELELDWKKTYLAILDDLNVSHLRLAAYWDEIEPVQNTYDFAWLDWQIEQASTRNRKIVLAIGRRLPRWPECHDPDWLGALTEQKQQEKLFAYLEKIVNRYKNEPTVIAWQVENEPLFDYFGICPKSNIELLRQEVEEVRKLDDRPIIITDSGELNEWRRAATSGDILGITMYRIVWNPYLGFWDYFFVPPSAYTYKARFAVPGSKNENAVIVSELQMEPWTLGKKMTELTFEEQRQSFDVDQFKKNVAYFEKTGFTQAYLWGAEYWYWLYEKGESELWSQAKKLW